MVAENPSARKIELIDKKSELQNQLNELHKIQNGMLIDKEFCDASARLMRQITQTQNDITQLQKDMI